MRFQISLIASLIFIFLLQPLPTPTMPHFSPPIPIPSNQDKQHVAPTGLPRLPDNRLGWFSIPYMKHVSEGRNSCLCFHVSLSLLSDTAGSSHNSPDLNSSRLRPVCTVNNNNGKLKCVIVLKRSNDSTHLSPKLLLF